MPNKTHPDNDEHIQPIDALLQVMATLRHPEHGCAWDIKQTHETIVPYTIEEAYEVAEAVKQGNIAALCDELGDLLLQVVFQARIAEEAGNFNFHDVAQSINDKMIRRHPHIFGEETYRSAEEQREAWEKIKEDERKSKNEHGILDGVATTLPPVMRAVKLQKRASRVGFDWQHPEPVLAKVAEELDEVTVEMQANPAQPEKLEEEIGDLLFAVVNLARKAGVDPDQALTRTNEKFIHRFQSIEARAHTAGKDLNDVELEDMERWWQEAKSKR